MRLFGNAVIRFSEAAKLPNKQITALTIPQYKIPFRQ